MIPAPLRLRRAILTPSSTLVTRILNSHPHLLLNPDFSPSGLSNTNLHLAASLGHLDIVRLLLERGHERDGVSLNEEFQTPLMLASMGGWAEVVDLLVRWVDVDVDVDVKPGGESGRCRRDERGRGEDGEEKRGEGDGRIENLDGSTQQIPKPHSSSSPLRRSTPEIPNGGGGGGVARRDRWGRDAIMYASRGGFDTCLQILLTFAPSLPSSSFAATDGTGPPQAHVRMPVYNNSTTLQPSSVTPGAITTSTTTSSHTTSNNPLLSSTTHAPPPSSTPINDLALPAPETALLLRAADIDGNTALHFASSNGHLLVLRTLLAAGADAEQRNVWSWTAMSYSASVAAEVYFKGLVGETERRRGAAAAAVGGTGGTFAGLLGGGRAGGGGVVGVGQGRIRVVGVGE